MAQAYVDRIYNSYAGQNPQDKQSKTEWLNKWRGALKDLGRIAKESVDAGIPDFRAALQDWSYVMSSKLYLREHFALVPLLQNTRNKARHDEATFRQFMRDLATLADL
jgi:hypothetical protein